MELYVAGNTAYFRNIGMVEDQDLKINLCIPDLDYKSYNVSVKINDFPSRSCVNSFTIKREQLKQMESLKVDVTVRHRASGKKIVFKMDKIPVRRTFAIGGDSRDNYPVALKDVQDRFYKLEKRNEIISKALVELSMRGEIL